MDARAEDITHNLSFADTAAWCSANKYNASQCTPLFWRLKAKEELGIDLDELFAADDGWPYPAKYRWAENAMNSFPFTTEARDQTYRNEILWRARAKRDFNLTDAEFGDAYLFVHEWYLNERGFYNPLNIQSIGLLRLFRNVLANQDISHALLTYLILAILAHIPVWFGSIHDFMDMSTDETFGSEGLGKRMLQGGLQWVHGKHTFDAEVLKRLGDDGIRRSSADRTVTDASASAFLDAYGAEGLANLMRSFSLYEGTYGSFRRVAKQMKNRTYARTLLDILSRKYDEDKRYINNMQRIATAVRADAIVTLNDLVAKWIGVQDTYNHNRHLSDELKKSQWLLANYASRHYPMSGGSQLTE